MAIKYFTAEPELNINAPAPSETTSLTIAYETHGSPDQPAVLMPTCFGGTLEDTFPFLRTPPPPAGGGAGPDGTEQPPAVLASYFVITCGLLGGGESSSPSNTHPSLRGAAFPETTYEDNIRLQYALCRALGVQSLAAYIGYSMGGQQAYHMATLYPDFVQRAVVVAGSARTSWHNWNFLEGPKAALTSAVDWHDGHYTQPVVEGVRAYDRVCSTWALSPAWYRARTWEALGYGSLQEYLEANWNGGQDAHDLLHMTNTWQKGDISLYGSGTSEEKGDLSLPAALAGIQAKVLLMPGRTDCYFPPEDSEEEVKHLRHGEVRVIESIWGHFAGGGHSTAEDRAFISREVARWLAN